LPGGHCLVSILPTPKSGSDEAQIRLSLIWPGNAILLGVWGTPCKVSSHSVAQFVHWQVDCAETTSLLEQPRQAIWFHSGSLSLGGCFGRAQGTPKTHMQGIPRHVDTQGSPQDARPVATSGWLILQVIILVAHQATIKPTVLLESTLAGFSLDCGTATHLGGGALSRAPPASWGGPTGVLEGAGEAAPR